MPWSPSTDHACCSQGFPSGPGQDPTATPALVIGRSLRAVRGAGAVAEARGYHIGFLRFFRFGFLYMLISVALCHLWLIRVF